MWWWCLVQMKKLISRAHRCWWWCLVQVKKLIRRAHRCWWWCLGLVEKLISSVHRTWWWCLGQVQEVAAYGQTWPSSGRWAGSHPQLTPAVPPAHLRSWCAAAVRATSLTHGSSLRSWEVWGCCGGAACMLVLFGSMFDGGSAWRGIYSLRHFDPPGVWSPGFVKSFESLKKC